MCLVIVIFVLQLGAELAITPLNEGMDFLGHLAYLSFVASRSRPPSPTELSMPAWLGVVEQLPGPDFTDGTQYRAWAGLPPEQRRATVADVVAPQSEHEEYSGPNYESQQPPLYYAILSVPYRLTAPLELDVRTYLLSLLSVLLASAALPAVYATLRLYVMPSAALASTLAVAWFPNLLAFLGRISNDDLAWPLIAWAVYLIARVARGDRRLPTVIGAGVLLWTRKVHQVVRDYARTAVLA